MDHRVFFFILPTVQAQQLSSQKQLETRAREKNKEKLHIAHITQKIHSDQIQPIWFNWYD